MIPYRAKLHSITRVAVVLVILTNPRWRRRRNRGDLAGISISARDCPATFACLTHESIHPRVSAQRSLMEASPRFPNFISVYRRAKNRPCLTWRRVFRDGQYVGEMLTLPVALNQGDFVLAWLLTPNPLTNGCLDGENSHVKANVCDKWYLVCLPNRFL